MNLLYAGLALFVLIHVLPPLGGLRAAAVGALGEGPWKLLHTAVNVGAIVLIVLGWKAQAPVEVYAPPAWGRPAALVLMFAALWLLVGRRMGSNLKRWTAHPMLWGFTLWALAHLLANGDQRSLAAFGTLGVYSLFAMWWLGRRGLARKAVESWPMRSEFYAFSVTLAVYAMLIAAHGWLSGVPLF